jgi:hypothetical protein
MFIFIYSTVLQNNVYNSIIEGSPAEIRFDFQGNISDTQITSTLTDIRSNPKVADAQLLYGQGRIVTTTSGFGTEIGPLGELDGVIKISETKF